MPCQTNYCLRLERCRGQELVMLQSFCVSCVYLSLVSTAFSISYLQLYHCHPLLFLRASNVMFFVTFLFSLIRFVCLNHSMCHFSIIFASAVNKSVVDSLIILLFWFQYGSVSKNQLQILEVSYGTSASYIVTVSTTTQRR